MGRGFQVRRWTAESGAAVVVAAGELDHHAAPSLRALLAETGADVVFDLREASFIDSSFIGLLAGHVKRAGGGRLACANANVLRTLRITGMDRVFEISATLTEAIKSEPSAEPPPKREMRLAPVSANLALARAFASAAARRFGLDPRKRHDFTLAANEAVTNAIEHGAPLADEKIHLWVSAEGSVLTLAVRDGGHFDLGPPPGDPLAEHGRGLRLISRLVDRVDVRCGHAHTEVALSQFR
jgi:anti-sigma B factor antagonist